MGIVLAADTGGTFTDLAGYDSVSGQLFFGKTLTEYSNLVDGVLKCIEAAGIRIETAELLKHGTTHIINAFVQRKGARAALVTTRGFRDVLKIGRSNRPVTFSLTFEKDPPLIPRSMTFGVEGRIDASGRESQPIDAAEIAALGQSLKEQGVDAIAVSLLNAYANPAHELAVARILRECMPTAFISTGTELSKEWYEYERASTASANAYVGPRAKEYLDRFRTDLNKAGFKKTFYMMASNGGVLSARQAAAQPLALLESGPVGGCIGAVEYARELGIEKLVAFDMGGTTAKCVTVEDGRFEIQPSYFVSGYERGFPIRTPILDIVEVGAGGGSIASVDVHGRLTVGPRSAGAEPGPVAFGRGGKEPTVTDANLILGRIGAGAFVGGKLKLDKEAAEAAILERIAKPLGYTGADAVERAAAGILAIANATMAAAVKEITIERGLDVREFDLFVFGGGGPLHGAALARELGMRKIVVPPHPGNFSALGMLLADPRIDESRTLLAPFVEETLAQLSKLCAEMEAQIKDNLRDEFDATEVQCERQAEMRYVGQMHTIRVSFERDSNLPDIASRFHALYGKRYGHADEQAQIEFVGVRMTGTAKTRRPSIASLFQQSAAQGEAQAIHREVYFPEVQARQQTAVYRREHLAPGLKLNGPVILEDYGSTLVAGPLDRLEIGRLGEVLIYCEVKE